jgi:hypothetical protein
MPPNRSDAVKSFITLYANQVKRKVLTSQADPARTTKRPSELLHHKMSLAGQQFTANGHRPRSNGNLKGFIGELRQS